MLTAKEAKNMTLPFEQTEEYKRAQRKVKRLEKKIRKAAARGETCIFVHWGMNKTVWSLLEQAGYCVNSYLEWSKYYISWKSAK